MNKYDEEALIGRARVAYTRSGGSQLAGQDSNVQDISGTIYVTLRNVKGILAVYQYDPQTNSLTGLKEWPSELNQ